MFVVISIMYCGNDMATRGFIVDVLCIIQVIEITQTILPLRKCYGFKNRGRVGIRKEKSTKPYISRVLRLSESLVIQK